jgi:Na+/H+-dicarboxylate symporter
MERDREFVSLRWVVAGILIGIVGGLLLNRAGGAESPLFGVVGLGADLFIRLLRMVIVPLVVASLISAAAGLDTRYLGRLGVITLVYYTTTTLMAAALGLVIVNLVDPGVGAVLQGAQTPKEILEREPPTFADLLRNLIPANPIDALARADMLQIISFSLIVGVALNLMGDRAQALKGFVAECSTSRWSSCVGCCICCLSGWRCCWRGRLVRQAGRCSRRSLSIWARCWAGWRCMG